MWNKWPPTLFRREAEKQFMTHLSQVSDSLIMAFIFLSLSSAPFYARHSYQSSPHSYIPGIPMSITNVSQYFSFHHTSGGVNLQGCQCSVQNNLLPLRILHIG